MAAEEQKRSVDKARIVELVGRLRGTGGLPLSEPYAKCLRSWLQTLSSRGWLDVNFLKNKQLVHSSFVSTLPNSGTRSNFSRAILQYFAALTDSEFESEFPGLSRQEAVDNVRLVATEANKGINVKFQKGGSC